MKTVFLSNFCQMVILLKFGFILWKYLYFIIYFVDSDSFMYTW